jgi:hypothetical protein
MPAKIVGPIAFGNTIDKIKDFAPNIESALL